MYQYYAELRDSRGMKDSDVAKLADIRQGILSDWKNGKSEPNYQNKKKIAYVFNVPVEYFDDGKMPEKKYSDEIMKLAQEIHDNPAYRRLLEVARCSSDYDLSMMISILKRLNQTDPFEDIRGRFPQ